MSEWVIPCNAKKFDIFEHFKSNKEIAFKRVGALKEGDLAYIYLSAPYSEIHFLCKVINDHLTDEELSKHQYALDKFSSARYVLLSLESEYENGSLPLSKLKENGLGQVQRQARAGNELLNYIEKNGLVKGE